MKRAATSSTCMQQLDPSRATGGAAARALNLDLDEPVSWIPPRGGVRLQRTIGSTSRLR